MTLLERHEDTTSTRSPQSVRLKQLMDEARRIRRERDAGKISELEAEQRLGQLRTRHLTFFQRVLEI